MSTAKQTKTIVRATAPDFCGKSETQVAEAAFSGQRSRPVCAVTDEGEFVVCCRTTARKHGWEVQGKMYKRARSGSAVVAAPAPAPVSDKPTAAAKPAKAAKPVKMSKEVAALLK